MRHQFIDIAKLGGIFFVILGHLPTSAYIHTYIYSFHMPLFFIISGYLHKPYSNQETIKRNTYTLIIPYILLFTCVQILELQDIFRRGNINFSLVGSTLATSFKAMILGEPRIYVGPLWFLISLFEIKIIANILLKQKQSVIIIGCLCCLVLGYFCQYKNEFSYFFLDSTVIAFPFYIIGSYLRKYNFENDTFSLHHYNQAYNKTTKLKKVSLLIILIAITNILSYYNGAIEYRLLPMW